MEFVTPTPYTVDLLPWIIPYLTGPLVVKGIAALFRHGVHSRLKDVSPAKRDKVALHLVKGVLYIVSAALMMPPMAAVLRDELNSDPPRGIAMPFEDPFHNYRYVKWAASIPSSLYIYELVSDPRPSFMTWLHHGAALFGTSCVFIGAIPWFDLNDAMLFAYAVLITWGCLSWGFITHGFFAAYHLATTPSTKLRVTVVTKWVVLCGPCFWQHLLLWVYAGLKWYAFHTWSPYLFLLTIDLALFTEHVYHFYVCNAMARRLRVQVQSKRAMQKEKLKKGFKRVIAIQKLNNAVKTTASPTTPQTAAVVQADGRETDLETLLALHDERPSSAGGRLRWALRALHLMMRRDAEDEAAEAITYHEAHSFARMGKATPSLVQTLSDKHKQEAIDAVPLRILALDGGGVKGLNLVAALRELSTRMDAPLHEMFDLVVGTSAGGILATGITAGASPDTLEELMYAIANDVMSNSSLVNLATGGAKIPEAVSVAFVAKALKLMGIATDASMPTPAPQSVPHCFVVTTTQEGSSNSGSEPWVPYLLSNYRRSSDAVVLGSERWSAGEALLATSAAPTYFAPVIRPRNCSETRKLARFAVDENSIGAPEHRNSIEMSENACEAAVPAEELALFDNSKSTVRFVDGGLVANNPTWHAVIEAQRRWPGRPIGVVVSLGCGKCVQQAKRETGGVLYWAGEVMNMATESAKTHKQVKAYVQTLQPKPAYFRLEGHMGDVALDEYRPEKLEAMRAGEAHFLARKATKIDRVCDTLRELTERAQKAHSAQLERSVRAEATESKSRPTAPQHLDAV